MAWKPEEIAALRELAGVYRLDGGCWAVLRVKDKSIPPGKTDAWPEGVEYSWAILMPGQAPTLRGERMAGVDNADDSIVRKESEKLPLGPQHRAHEHKPDWKRIKIVAEQEWPLAGKATRLAVAPASPGDLWNECMRCLEQLFEELGLNVPTSAELMEARTTEEDFQQMQSTLRVKAKRDGLVPGR